jgi:hypothetical protein
VSDYWGIESRRHGRGSNYSMDCWCGEPDDSLANSYRRESGPGGHLDECVADDARAREECLEWLHQIHRVTVYQWK